MKLRYYLRGLGIGVLVTALVMGLTGETGKESLSDAEIRERAEALGMVDSSGLVLSDLLSATSEPAGADGTPVPNASGEPGSGATPGTPAPNASGEPGSGAIPGTPAPNASEEPGSGTTPGSPAPNSPEEAGSAVTLKQNVGQDSSVVTFVIEEGYASASICQAMEELGLVADAEEFNNLILIRGKTRRIMAGTYEVSTDIEEEELARMITGNR